MVTKPLDVAAALIQELSPASLLLGSEFVPQRLKEVEFAIEEDAPLKFGAGAASA